MATPKVPTVTVVKQPAKPYRTNSARQLYWATFNAHHNKPLAALQAAIAAAPPSQPTKGKLKGKPEPFAGWLAYFVRQGLVTIAVK